MPQLQKISKNNTKVTRDEFGAIMVTLHDTLIVSFDKNTIILNTGGWFTNVTRDRMNQTSNEYDLGYQVTFNKNGYVAHYKGKVYEFINDEIILKR